MDEIGGLPMTQGSVAQTLCDLGKRAAKQNSRLSAAFLALSVLCIIIFMAVATQPNISSTMFIAISYCGISSLIMALMFKLMSWMMFRWAALITLVIVIGVGVAFHFAGAA